MQTKQPASLPPADQLSTEHSARVREHIRGKIAAAGGQISFAEFMQEALYAPGLGYYTAGACKFGATGDFITAPEVSSVFGGVLARQAAEVLTTIENGAVLEFGAGSGKLAADVLVALDGLGALPASYDIVEVSADLQQRQQQRLQQLAPHLFKRVRWLTDLPSRFDGVIIANEVLDALPFERFVRRASGFFRLDVSNDGENFVWAESAASEPLLSAVEAVEADLGERLADGYTSEVSLASSHWIGDLAKCLSRGAVFLFDYGVSHKEFYAVDRSDGWLRCHFRHHAHSNPLVLPGIQDLTSWVNFSAVAAAAVSNGMELLGYQTQSQFLLGGGLQQEMQDFDSMPAAKQIELSGQVKTLTLPGEMGENFKCIALGRGDIDAPTAFHFSDRTQTL